MTIPKRRNNDDDESSNDDDDDDDVKKDKEDNEEKEHLAPTDLSDVSTDDLETMTTVNQGMSVEEIKRVVAQRVANAIEAIAIYETKTNLAHKSMSQTKQKEKEKVSRAHTSWPINKKAYAGSLPLCNQCKSHHSGPYTVKCGNYKKVGHIIQNCRAPATARNQRTRTCYECGSLRHHKSECLIVKFHKCMDMIHERMRASKPKTMQDAVEIATKLRNKKISTLVECQIANKKRLDNTPKNNQYQQQPNKRCTSSKTKKDSVVADLTPEEKKRYKADIRATNILLQGLLKDIYTLINHYTNAKDIWDNVKMLLEGSELMKDDHESQLYDDFEHFLQNKGETNHEYYIRFTKLINDMRNIKMTMPKMQLNSKFMNNMLLEWGRFVIVVKLNRGLKESNYDQMYAYLKQHEAHANENKMMLERYNQHAIDPLALVSNILPLQYVSQSSTIPQSTYVPPVSYQPQFDDNTQLDSGLTPTDKLI
nr:reverse transcriptase domain-containing protein [Tanacetum cinerariifolium]